MKLVKKFLMITVVLCFLLGIPLVVHASQTNYETYANELNVNFNGIATATDTVWNIAGMGKSTESGQRIGNWGEVNGWAIVYGDNFDYLSVTPDSNNPDFYIMLNDFIKGQVKMELTVYKELNYEDAASLEFYLWDNGLNSQIGNIDLAAQLNAASSGEWVTITDYLDLSMAVAVDSMVLRLYTNGNNNVQFRIKEINFTWYEGVSFSSDDIINVERVTQGEYISFDGIADETNPSIDITSSAIVTDSGYTMGNWGSPNGFYLENSSDGDTLSVKRLTDDWPRIWIALSNFSEQEVKIELEVYKPSTYVSVDDFGLDFWDAGLSTNFNINFTDQLNQASSEEWVTITTYVDLSTAQNIDSVQVYIHNPQEVSTEIKISNINITYEETTVMDDISFNGIVLDGETQEMTQARSTLSGYGYGGWGSWFVKNTSGDEYIQNVYNGVEVWPRIWINGLQTVQQAMYKVELEVATVEGYVSSDDFGIDFWDAGLSRAWNFKFDISNVSTNYTTISIYADLTDSVNVDSIQLYIHSVDANTSVKIKNIKLILIEDNEDTDTYRNELSGSVDTIQFASQDNGIYAVDDVNDQYLQLAYNSTETITGYISATNFSAGDYEFALTYRVLNSFTTGELTMKLYNSITDQVVGQVDYSQSIASGIKNEWQTVVLILQNDQSTTFDQVLIEYNTDSNVLNAIDIKYIDVRQVSNYVEVDNSPVVLQENVYDFEGNIPDGQAEYNMAADSLVSIGNWGATTHGQKIIYDGENEVMYLYKKSSDYSVFFYLCTETSGDFNISITIKKLTDTPVDYFYIEGYITTQWWGLADFTYAYNQAPVGEYVTLSVDTYLPVVIDSMKLTYSTTDDGNQVYIKDITTYREVSDSALVFFDASDPEDFSRIIDLKNYALSSVKENNIEINTGNYSFEDNVFTLSSSYISTLDNGEYTYEISTDKGSLTFELYVFNIAPLLLSESQSYSQFSEDSIILSFDFKGSDFENISFSGSNLSSEVDYTINENLGTIVFSNSYLDKLGIGEHQFTLITSDGSVDFTITETEEIQTGLGIASIIGISVGGLATLAVGFVVIKKKFIK